MSKFGWWYPPGAANDPNAPYNQSDEPCYICGKFPDDCICSECPQCGAFGDKLCYKQHGMVYTEEQITANKEYKEMLQREAEEEAKRCDAYIAELEAIDKSAKEYFGSTYPHPYGPSEEGKDV